MQATCVTYCTDDNNALTCTYSCDVCLNDAIQCQSQYWVNLAANLTAKSLIQFYVTLKKNNLHYK